MYGMTQYNYVIIMIFSQVGYGSNTSYSTLRVDGACCSDFVVDIVSLRLSSPSTKHSKSLLGPRNAELSPFGKIGHASLSFPHKGTSAVCVCGDRPEEGGPGRCGRCLCVCLCVCLCAPHIIVWRVLLQLSLSLYSPISPLYSPISLSLRFDCEHALSDRPHNSDWQYRTPTGLIRT